jgi:hypothetical protein
MTPTPTSNLSYIYTVSCYKLYASGTVVTLHCAWFFQLQMIPPYFTVLKIRLLKSTDALFYSDCLMQLNTRGFVPFSFSVTPTILALLAKFFLNGLMCRSFDICILLSFASRFLINVILYTHI